MKMYNNSDFQALFEAAELMIELEPEMVFNKQFKRIIRRIEKLEKESGIDFLEGVRRYNDMSEDAEERQAYFSFNFYLKAITNCIRNI